MIKILKISSFMPILFIVFISVFFIPIFCTHYNFTSCFNNSSFNSSTNPSNYFWPTPGYSKITSKFGYRNSPTSGASSYHGGIDIAAPQNSAIISIYDGIVIFAGWYGANGYTIIIDHQNNYKSIYGHISPNFLVSVGTKVKKGDLIARVGPKYIETTIYTKYKDATGKYTNGATTRAPSAFCYRKKW